MVKFTCFLTNITEWPCPRKLRYFPQPLDKTAPSGRTLGIKKRAADSPETVGGPFFLRRCRHRGPLARWFPRR
ncbi:uncharacterized protein METZ01_LOCUS392097 [marine metagenome]|uniref:Uncharacterized protein n=1 Tax=marine metagenome TaxID=408172 RepID=A0A382UYB3_9ZZZZ